MQYLKCTKVFTCEVDIYLASTTFIIYQIYKIDSVNFLKDFSLPTHLWDVVELFAAATK